MSKSDRLREKYSVALREVASGLSTVLDEKCGHHVGFTLFVFDLTEEGSDAGDGAISYLSNATRSDMIEAVREWLALQDAGITSGPPGPKSRG